MKVSVIVPVYNVEKYLEKCLNSLVNQTFKEKYEIIVVNDGSPDNSQKIIDEYKKKYSDKIRAFKKENGGLSSARNYGISKAKGEYIAFIDSDDYVSTNYLEMMYNKVVDEQCDLVVCDFIQKSISFEKLMSGSRNLSPDLLKDILISYPTACNKLYKKSLFINNNILYPDKIYYEDLATTPKLLVNAKKIGYINTPLYYYIVRTGSITNQEKYNPKTADIFKSISLLTVYFKDNNFFEEYKDEIEYLYIINLLHGYTIGVYNYDDALDNIGKAVELIKLNFPKFRKNKYYKMENIKFKIVCNLIYYKKISLLRTILRHGGKNDKN